MSLFFKQRVVIIIFVYCFVVVIICGMWFFDGNFGWLSGFVLELQFVLGELEDGLLILFFYGVLMVGVWKLIEVKVEIDLFEEKKVLLDLIFLLEIMEDDYVVFDF